VIKCHLSTILGRRKEKVSECSESTGINKNTLYALYHERTQRIELDVLDKLCEHLECSVGELFEHVQ